MSSESDQIVGLFRKVLRRRKAYVFFSIVAVLGPVVYYNETATPVYEAATTIVFDEFVDPVNSFSSQYSRDILTSNRLQEIESFAFAREIVKSLPDDIRARFRMPENPPENFDAERFRAEVVQRSVSAWPLRDSNLVRIAVQLYDPVLCTRIANSAVVVYQERNHRIKEQGVSGIRRFVEEQLERFQTQLDRSEQALRAYKEKNKATAFDQQAQEILRRMTEAEVLSNSAEASRKAMEQRLETIQTQLAEQKRDLVPSVTDVANPSAQRLQEQLVELQLQYTELLVQDYDPAHPKMRQLSAEIEKTKKNLTEKAMEIAGGQRMIDPFSQIESWVTESLELQIEIESTKAQEKALRRVMTQYDQTLSSLPEKELNLARLTRERDVNQKIYNNLLEKLEESKISQAERIPSIRTLDSAILPEEPVRPTKKVNLVLGFLVGLIAGTGLGLVRESSRGAIDTTRELERLIEWPVVGAIPKIQRIPPVKLKHSTGSKRNERDSRRIKRSLITILQPDGGPAEAYRMLRTNLQAHGLGDEVRTLLVTSVSPDDGKSTVVSNLAIATATMGERTLLFDAEVRHPGMHVVFDVEEKPGLTDVLLAAAGTPIPDEAAPDAKKRTSDGGGVQTATKVAKSGPDERQASVIRMKLDQVIQRTRVRNLQVLSSGTTIPNTSDTLSMHEAELRSVLEQLKRQYQFIVIDGPPLPIVHDAALLAKIADGVLFVVNSTHSDKEMLLNCKSILESSGANVVGAVLNHVDPTGVYKKNKYYTGS